LEKLNTFNNSFIKSAPNATQNMQLNHEDSECRTFLEHIHVTENDVKKTIQDMESNKPTGADGLPPIFFKICAEELAPVLADLYNQMLSEGIFPKILKEAYLFPLYKGKGSRNSVKSYRPISILSCSAKILEKIIYQSINTFLDDPEKLSDSQHGFRNQRSTLSATLRVTDDIKIAGDQRLLTGAVFVDFESAFDLIQPTILIQKLQDLGIRGKLLQWFTSYFKNRIIKVKKDDLLSDTLDMLIGAPQGSSLSGILFAVYINNIVKYLNKSKCVKYADDLVIYFSGKTIEEVQSALQEDIDNLQRWAKEHGMIISCTKTKCMIFKPSNLKCNISSFRISLNAPIDTVDTFKYLGILLDSSLHFNNHVNEVCKKMTSRMYLINRYKRFFSTKWKKIFATSLVLSLSDYALPVWGDLRESSYYRFHKILIKLGTLVIMPCTRTELSTQDLFEKLNWLSVKERYALYSLKFIFKHLFCKSSLTRCFPEFVRLDSSTRHKFDFVVPRLKTVFGMSSFFYRGIKLWNDLSSKIKSVEKLSLVIFESLVRESLLKDRESIFVF